MKVYKKSAEFQPVSITLETQEELDAFNYSLRKGFYVATADSYEVRLASSILDETDPKWNE